MIELFPEMGLTEDSDYFKKIPPSTFDAKNIIEQYGKRLRELRTERGCSLQRVADYIGVDFQAISQVEKGVRKKISRNRLLLLCAFFQCSPEVLLGLEPNTTRVELFFDRQSRDRAFYVVDHLVSLDYPRETDVALLMHFFGCLREREEFSKRRLPFSKMLQTSEFCHILMQQKKQRSHFLKHHLFPPTIWFVSTKRTVMRFLRIWIKSSLICLMSSSQSLQAIVRRVIWLYFCSK